MELGVFDFALRKQFDILLCDITDPCDTHAYHKGTPPFLSNESH